jgi:hypothetical protein
MKDRQGTIKTRSIRLGHRVATEALDSAVVHFWKMTPDWPVPAGAPKTRETSLPIERRAVAIIALAGSRGDSEQQNCMVEGEHRWFGLTTTAKN